MVRGTHDEKVIDRRDISDVFDHTDKTVLESYLPVSVYRADPTTENLKQEVSISIAYLYLKIEF